MSNQLSGRHLLGISLALTTAIFWGFLPIALKIALTQIDSYSIVFYRFVGAGLLLGCFLWATKKLPRSSVFSAQFLPLFFAASAGLLLNYIFFNSGLEYLNPETTQVLIQTANFLLILGGIVIYREPFSRLQKFGVMLLVLGLLAFFNENLKILFGDFTDYTLGVVLILIAAITWSAYALIQKKLLRSVTSMQLMLLIYTVGSLAFLPLAEPFKVFQMDLLPLLMLAFCVVNTLIAYGAFTAAMEHIHTSQVSAIVTLAPIFTFLAMFVAVDIFPTYFSNDEINLLSYIGGCIVVMGSILAAMGKFR